MDEVEHRGGVAPLHTREMMPHLELDNLISPLERAGGGVDLGMDDINIGVRRAGRRSRGPRGQHSCGGLIWWKDMQVQRVGV